MSLIPTLNQPTTNQARVPAPLVANDLAIQAVVNGDLDHENLADGGITTAKLADGAVTGAKLAATAIGDSDQGDKLGVNGASTVRRGKSIIATEESRTNTAFGTLTTPDQVDDIVLPTDGLLFVVYQARWKESVDGAAGAAIFLGSNELQVADAVTSTGSGSTSRASISGGGTGYYRPLTSWALGLASWGFSTGSGGGDIGTQVTTGQAVGGGYEQMLASAGGLYTQPLLVGGACIIFAAAGTYDVSVRFKAGSGSVTVKERKLWVWTQGF